MQRQRQHSLQHKVFLQMTYQHKLKQIRKMQQQQQRRQRQKILEL
jgi:hypothetical protein